MTAASESGTMRVRYLPVNMAFVVTYGEQIVAIGEDRGRRFWESRDELDAELKRLGLESDRNSGLVTMAQGSGAGGAMGGDA